MESLPELENLTAAHDRPKSKWKRLVIWCVVVLLVLVNVYYLAVARLPRWAPKFTRRYIPHPTSLARVMAGQLEKGDNKGAEDTHGKIVDMWFVSSEPSNFAIQSPWAQQCFRDVFIRGDKWEKLAVLDICASLTCPGCQEAISAEIPNLDPQAKVLAATALSRLKKPDVLPDLAKLLSDPATKVRNSAVSAISSLDLWLTDAGDKRRVLDLLRGALKVESDKATSMFTAHEIASIRGRDMRSLPKVVPDDELLDLLRSSFVAAKWRLSVSLVGEQIRGALDASWYPVLNEIFEKDTFEKIRGNCALILILADDPQSEVKLKFIEAFCDPKFAPLPLTKAKIVKEITDSRLKPATFVTILRRWNPNSLNAAFSGLQSGNE